ncbi:hypothetical protein CSHISOI_10215 [Colletotrichum shisoi]|uniref:Uncharacterized protein n=1 Tax=Colletotrichum shisoi TaxID=2078593 RepID=A0A5Q4BEU1_9PEZI|nr:hypothetical protein CSHISOI_10215 [Colletotrichum shisoi]
MWVLQLFFQYLDRSTAARLRVQNDNGLVPGTEKDSGSYHASARAETNGQDAVVVWSTTEEANQFLLAQTENDFAFGEGGILDWNPDTPNSVFPVAGEDPPAAALEF